MGALNDTEFCKEFVGICRDNSLEDMIQVMGEKRINYDQNNELVSLIFSLDTCRSRFFLVRFRNFFNIQMNLFPRKSENRFESELFKSLERFAVASVDGHDYYEYLNLSWIEVFVYIQTKYFYFAQQIKENRWLIYDRHLTLKQSRNSNCRSYLCCLRRSTYTNFKFEAFVHSCKY